MRTAFAMQPQPQPSLAARVRAPLVVVGIGLLAAAALFGFRAHPAPPLALPLPKPPVPEVAAPDAGPTAAPTVDPAPPPAPREPPAEPGPSATPARFEEQLDVSTFQKGNIHTHTTFSDGDRPPPDVYSWYRDRGYNFLAVTDHNKLTDPADFRSQERKKRFVMITGEEVTMRGAGRQVHVNALCTERTIGGKLFDTQRQALAWAVAQIRAQGGVALVNHPNWDWALTAADLPAARGAQLLEISSGHPYVHTAGDETHLSHEAIWDWATSSGESFAGVAVDDAHIYGANAPVKTARPGRDWVQVFAAEATRKDICSALARGRLYSSTGPSLKRIAVTENTYAVWPADRTATVEFIGWRGKVLQSKKPDDDGAAIYKLAGGEGYVRARITTASGKQAWTQPSRLAP